MFRPNFTRLVLAHLTAMPGALPRERGVNGEVGRQRSCFHGTDSILPRTVALFPQSRGAFPPTARLLHAVTPRAARVPQPPSPGVLTEPPRGGLAVPARGYGKKRHRRCLHE